MKKYVLFIVTCFLLFGTAVYCQTNSQKAKADFYNTEGEKIGTANFIETTHGVLIKAELWKLPQGAHAFHIHAIGKCDPPSFKSSGEHFNPGGKEHGFLNPNGPHAGDLPNIYVGDDGKLTFEVLASDVTLDKGLNSVFDEDGSALVIHAGPDDYKSDPTGEAGPRIACGIISRQLK